MFLLVALTIASASPCPDEGMHHCLIEAAALASVQTDNLAARVVSAMKEKGVNPKVMLRTRFRVFATPNVQPMPELTGAPTFRPKPD